MGTQVVIGSAGSAPAQTRTGCRCHDFAIIANYGSHMFSNAQLAPPPFPLSAPVSAKHILTFAETLNGGGVERAMLRLAAEWIAAGRRATIVVGTTRGPLAAELPPEADVVELGRKGIVTLRVLPRIVRAVRPDVIFCPGNHYTSTAAWTRLRLGEACPPIVAKVSNTLVRTDMPGPIKAGYQFWLRRHPVYFDHFVAMTSAMRDETIRMMGARPETVSVIANPPPKLAPHERQMNGFKSRSLLGIGRLEPQKRWDRLIDALPRLADTEAVLTIVGEGRDRPRLEAQIASLGLSDRVRLPGYISNPASLIAHASVAVLTSEFEGVPGVLREALALGTPVVTTASSVAVHEIVSSPSMGSIVPVGDDTALIAALDHWLTPGRPRPDPVPFPGLDSATAYLDLFDRLAASANARVKRRA